MADPVLAAAAQILDQEIAEMREAIEGMPPDALNWKPAGEESNSVAVLVVHAMSSTRWWLSVATGSPLPTRDRPSEFLATMTTNDELLATIDQMTAECRALLDVNGPIDLGALRQSREETVTGAWALLHALEHLREHVGHAQLTRQLREQMPRRAQSEGEEVL